MDHQPEHVLSVFGALHGERVATTYGQFFKMEGVTNVGSLGYAISPISAEAALAAGVSAQAAGLKAGYVNANFPFGSTNVQPIALGMKSAGVDGVAATVDPNTGFALITRFDRWASSSRWRCCRPATAATSSRPVPGRYSVQAAGATPTHASLISALSGIHDFTAGGLYGSHHLDINDRTNFVQGVDNCYQITKLSGSTFQLVPGADPICGTVVPGKTVSASS